jgi:uncharacterized protein YecT (DUF1311 family)
MSTLLLLAAVAAAQPQPNCKKAVTQTDMNICSGRFFKAADAAMVRQYNITAARMKQMDKGGEPTGYFAALLESQRAWLKYRDAECRLEGYSTRGGTAETMNVNGCLEQLTKQRTADLKSFLEAF